MALSASAAGAIGLGYALLRNDESDRGRAMPGPWGPVRPDPDGVLDLPEGFSYRVLSRSGEPMSDGWRTPARPDGMACFDLGDGTLALLRNHENPRRVASLGPWNAAPPTEAWDADAMGGVSRIVLSADSIETRSTNLVLGGTELNCSGGPSPWGWLSCEESFGARHGHVFACDPRQSAIQPAQRIAGYGKFRHEAVAIDPRDCTAYLTEDRGDGCLYRFVPHDPARPFEGTLSAMAVSGRSRFDTGAGMRVGQSLELRWVPLRNPEPEDDVLRHEAQALGAAIVRRGEGASWNGERNSIVVCATAGGPRQAGQIFELRCERDRGELVLIAQSERDNDIDMPDNIAVAPFGTPFFCEDGGGRNHLRGIAPDGTVFEFAMNRLSSSELAGVCFSPDGSTMFVNLQSDGLTLAIRGPFIGRA